MKKNYKLLFLFSALLWMTLSTANAQTIRYVKQGGTGNGSSWENASGDLQEMINASNEKDQVWVAKGTYKPNRRPDDIDVPIPESKVDRYRSFLLKAEVSVYGGFEGTETELIDRDVNKISTDNETILSGNIGNQNTNEDNTFHVVTIAGEMGPKTIFDGFTVEDGYTEATTGTPSIVVNNQNVPSTRSPGIIVYFVNFIEFRNLIVRNNTNAAGDQSAGAIYFFSGGGGNVRNVQFINNKTMGGSGGAVFTYGLSNINCNINFYNVSFIGNESSSNAGAVYMSQYSNLNFYDCNFESNKAGSEGGVFYLGSSTSNANFYNANFIGNEAALRGGALRAPNSGRLNITGGVFKDNQVLGTNAGGAISATASGLIMNIKGATFDNNKTPGNGGGAIYIGTGTYTIEDCTFTNNTCSTTGGAIFFEPNTVSPTKIINCNFEGNKSTTNGGAIYATGADIEIISSRFTKNTSVLSGGAFAIAGAGKKATIVNSLFVENEAQTTGGGGGAIYLFTSAAVNLYNSTLVNNRVTNTTYGGAFYLAASSILNLYNSLSYGNRASTSTTTLTRHDIYISTSGANVAIKNTLTEFYGTNGIDGNIVGQNPLFLSTTIGDPSFMEVSAGSPIIDRGIIADVPSAYLPIDFDALGKTRIHNGIIDIGGVEYLGAVKLEPTVYAVDENLAVDQKLGDNNKVDGDISAISNTPNYSLDGTITLWEIVGGNESGAFAIDPATGEISVANSIPLDYEATKQFMLTVRLTNGLDEQKLTVIVNIENVAETPSTPVVDNVVHSYVVTTYRPTIRGISEPGSTIVIFVGQRKKSVGSPLEYPYEDDDDANWEYVEYPIKVQTDEENGSWNYRFPQELASGFIRFKVLAEITIREVDPVTGEVTKRIERSPLSGYATVNLKLYGGGTSGLKPINVLTPNGDGKNDVWTIENLAVMYPRHDIVIYDKVGKTVFKWSSSAQGPYDSDNIYKSAWGGTDMNTGQLLPSGTYYYDIKVGNDGKMGLDRIKGTITIIRGR